VATDPAALREQAQEWGRALLLQPPWEPLTERLSLIMVSPPVDSTLEYAPPEATLWLLLDRPSMGSLPDTIGQPLRTIGAHVERHRATTTTPAITLAVRSVEAIEHQVEGVGRREFELRWTLLHAAPIADRLRRLEQLASTARLLPPDGLERAVRGLWLDAQAAGRALWPLASEPGHALTAAGELSGALLRLACLMDEGAYPPADWLRSAATGTRIGMRLGAWLDDLTAGLSSDDAAARRAVNAVDQVLEEVRLVLRERYADRDWLRDPAVYELRARR
jgi:hypothetical protein